MLELFGVLFITLFIALLLTLVLLNLDMMFKKGNVEKKVIRSKQRSNRKEHSPDELQVLMEAARNVAERGNKELNEVQDKYLETLPKHKTRMKLRNKRKGKK